MDLKKLDENSKVALIKFIFYKKNQKKRSSKIKQNEYIE